MEPTEIITIHKIKKGDKFKIKSCLSSREKTWYGDLIGDVLVYDRQKSENRGTGYFRTKSGEEVVLKPHKDLERAVDN